MKDANLNAAKNSYKDTLRLPQTSFPMRGNLVANEPQRLAHWEESNLYEEIIQRRKDQGGETFILHDGPPFANGQVHMGTALNKVLKDFVIKSRSMAGQVAPFIPGWDCHGLPIEFKVMQDALGQEPAEIRRLCEEYARGWIDKQRESFKRLGVLGDWDHPYLTLDPAYEADILRLFARMVERGLVYRSNKPVLWSYGAGTALAEAEVEYKNKKSPALFVAFAAESGPAAEFGASLVVWTTTPWTLPANRAIAVHPRLEYVLGTFRLSHQNPDKDGQERKLMIAAERLDAFAAESGWSLLTEHARLKGIELAGSKAKHPFLKDSVPVLEADFVTADSGTGQVHIAPGHGADDYLLGVNNGLEVFSPVDDGGLYTDEIGQGIDWLAELEGSLVFEANVPIIRQLAIAGALLGKSNHDHSYPHCWRSKTPVIFRAVPQFFVKIDELRAKALEEIDQTEWLPAWGRKRIRGTVESRPDWCISRQRTWGVPLPIFLDGEGTPLLDPELIGRIAKLVEEHGSNLWFEKDDAWWCQQLGLPADHSRTRDTLDVWIDSGSSHLAVLERRPELHAPADLYIEATDQHRGWFQSSLMLSVAWRNCAPYKCVITHGFVIDNSTGEKISKSGDKPINAEYFYSKYGADIVRLWCASVDYQNEVPFSDALFVQVVDSYRRVRNTLRILLGNLDGFDAAAHPLDQLELSTIDRWLLERLHVLTAEVTAAWDKFDFRRAYHLLTSFCSVELSSLYVDNTKDRLYCDAPDSPRRIAAQAVFATVFDQLTRLFAPILAYTADEAWEHAGHRESIHLEEFPTPDPAFAEASATPLIEAAHTLRDEASRQLEEARRAGTIGKTLEAEVDLTLPANHPVLAMSEAELAEYLIVSRVTCHQGDELKLTVRPSQSKQCPRCWQRLPEISATQALCQRCTLALNAC